jgi:hypothetical protein
MRQTVAFEEFDEEVRGQVDDDLTRASAGISAPARLASSVMNRVRIPGPTRMPEILDAIGWMGILSVAWCLAFFVILK